MFFTLVPGDGWLAGLEIGLHQRDVAARFLSASVVADVVVVFPEPDFLGMREDPVDDPRLQHFEPSREAFEVFVPLEPEGFLSTKHEWVRCLARSWPRHPAGFNRFPRASWRAAGASPEPTSCRHRSACLLLRAPVVLELAPARASRDPEQEKNEHDETAKIAASVHRMRETL